MKTFYALTTLWVLLCAAIVTQLWIYSPAAAIGAFVLVVLIATPAYFVGLNEGANRG